MTSSFQAERIKANPTGSTFLVELIQDSLTSKSEGEFLSLALQRLNQHAGCTGSTIVQGVKGQWRVLAHAGAGEGLPTDLLADALDTEICRQGEGWTAAPLIKPNPEGNLLACNSESVCRLC